MEEQRKIIHPNLYKIRNFYYSSMDESSYVKVYDMDYYEPDTINILTMPIDYVLDNLNDLGNLANQMVSHFIFMQVIHEGNVIMQNNKIILIDKDRDYYCCDDYLRIFYRNESEIIGGLIDSFLKQYKLMNKNDESLYYYNMNIISSHANFTYDEFIKTLLLYKRSIDYVKSKIKNFNDIYSFILLVL